MESLYSSTFAVIVQNVQLLKNHDFTYGLRLVRVKSIET